MGLETAAIVALVGAGATAYSAYSASQNAKKQINAQEDIAAKQVAATEAAAQAAQNAPKAAGLQGSKTPDMAAINAQNTAVASAGGSKAGNSSTFLTGPGGVDPGTLNLGKNTLLGE